MIKKVKLELLKDYHNYTRSGFDKKTALDLTVSNYAKYGIKIYDENKEEVKKIIEKNKEILLKYKDRSLTPFEKELKL